MFFKVLNTVIFHLNTVDNVQNFIHFLIGYTTSVLNILSFVFNEI